MQYKTKRGALAACAIGALGGLGIIGFGAYWFIAESQPYSGYTAEAEGRVIKASKVYRTVLRGGAGGTVEKDPLYSTVATFEVDEKLYQAKGETTCGWFVPGEGDRVRLVFVPGNPNTAKVRYAAGNEHWLSCFLMILGTGLLGLAIVPVFHVVRGKPFLGCEMPAEW